MSVLEMKAKCRRLSMDNKLSMIVIDYLQLMHSKGRIENRQQEISEITRSLKGLAKDLKVPVVVVSQLSRNPERREEPRPQLSDLRDSGAIEQDADVVAFIYRKAYYNRLVEDKTAEIIIAKQRNGPVGKIDLTFLEQFTRYENKSSREGE